MSAGSAAYVAAVIVKRARVIHFQQLLGQTGVADSADLIVFSFRDESIHCRCVLSLWDTALKASVEFHSRHAGRDLER